MIHPAAPDTQVQQIRLSALHIPSGWMLAPSSFLVDRIVPDMERIFLPATQTGGGQLGLHLGVQVFQSPSHGGGRVRLRPRKCHVLENGLLNPVMDLRKGYPENWAHFLNIHLCILALACRSFVWAPHQITLLLPEKTPGYIRTLTEILDLNCLFTDDDVKSYGLHFDLDHWDSIRGERHALLTDPTISPVAAALQSGRIPNLDSPEKLFLSRKNTRVLSNEAQIEDALAPLGFTKIYMEDLSPAEQLRYGLNARQVVAVHGAALAPLLYRNASVDLVELFPVGHITNVYRAVIAALGGRWCGVRGYIKAGHLKEIYRSDGAPYTKHSLDPFEVDPETVTHALSLLQDPPA